MEDWERLIGEETVTDAPTSTPSQNPQWCSSCRNLAKESEEKLLSNFIAVKQKIFFTDNLIQMHQDAKQQLEEMTKKYTQASQDKNLVESQLQLLLSKEQPSFSDGEKMQSRIRELEKMVEDLRTQLYAMDESRRLHEESIKVLKAEDNALKAELKKKHSQQMMELRKEMSEKNEENKKLTKRNKDLVDRVDRLRKKAKAAVAEKHAIESENRNVVVTQPVPAEVDFEQSVTDRTLILPTNDATPRALSNDMVQEEPPHHIDSEKSEVNSASGIVDNQNNGNEHKATSSKASITDQQEDANSKIPSVNIKSTNTTAAIEDVSGNDLDEEEKRIRLAEFRNNPSEDQTSELTEITRAWKSFFSRRCRLKKKDMFNLLFTEIERFCEKHSLQSHDDVVIAKLYELSKPLLNTNKRSIAWLQEAVVKLQDDRDAAVTEDTEVPVTSPETNMDTADNDSGKDDKQGRIEMEKRDKLSNEVNQADTSSADNDFVSVMPDIGGDFNFSKATPCAAGNTCVAPKDSSYQQTVVNEDVMSRMPSVGSPFNENSDARSDNLEKGVDEHEHTKPQNEVDFVSAMPVFGDEVESRSLRKKSQDDGLKRKFEKPTEVSRMKKVKRDEASVSSEQTPSRRRTRSMTASSSSDVDDTLSYPKSKKRTSRVKSKPLTSESSGKLSTDSSGKSNSINTKRISKSKRPMRKAAGTADDNPEVDASSRSPDKKALIVSSVESTVIDGAATPPPAKHKGVLLSDSDEDDKKMHVISKEFSEKQHVEDVTSTLAGTDRISGNDEISVTLTHAKSVSLSTSQSTESDGSAKDLSDIFFEMLGIPLSLSPLSSSPAASDNDITKVTVVEENTDKKQQNFSSDETQNLDADEAKGKCSISPSVDLCTAISFGTPSKDREKSETKTAKEKKDFSKAKVKVKLITQEDKAVSDVDKMTEKEVLANQTKDIFRPRRFSCEAPERAVNVPPLKPSTSRPLIDVIKSPAPTSCDGDNGNTFRFPQYRKETDIPSHWHSNVTLLDSSSSDSEKTETPAVVSVTESTPLNAKEGEMDTSTSEYDTDSVLSKMAVDVSLVGQLSVDSDSPKITKSDENTAFQSTESPSVAPSEEKRTVEPSKCSDIETKTLASKKNLNKKGPIDDIESSSSADDVNLVIDVSDEASVTSNRIIAEDTNAQLSNETNSEGSDKSAAQSSVSVSNFVSSDHDVEKDDDGIPILRNFHDLTQMLSKKNKMKALARIDENYVLDGVLSILKNTDKEVDLFHKQRTFKDDIKLSDLPLCEQKFLKRIRVICFGGVVQSNELVNTVIQSFMKILKKIGILYSLTKSGSDRIAISKDPVLRRLFPYMHCFSRLIGYLARMSALLRVFFFLCKLAKVSSPAYAVCRYHMLSRRHFVLIASVVEGLICWPEVLLQEPSYGKIYMNGISKDVTSSQVVGDKNRRAALLKRVNWIYDKCGWPTQGNALGLHRSVLDEVMPAITSCKLSSELRAFAGEENPSKEYDRCIPTFNSSVQTKMHTLELFPRELFVEQMKAEVFYGRFYPPLQSWAQHLYFHGKSKENREVTDDTIIAILESFSHILSFYLLRQKQLHKDQPTLPHLQEHFETICHLLRNLTTTHIDNAPKLVRCAAASFLLRNCFCNPNLAHPALLTWAEATAGGRNGSDQRNSHPELPLILTLIGGVSEDLLKKTCEWLDSRRSPSERTESLTQILWRD